MRDAVKAVVDQKAAEREETKARSQADRAKAARKPYRLRIVAALLGVALLVTVWLSIPLWQHPFDEPTGAVADHHARQALVFAAGLVRQYSAAHGAPPERLSDLNVQLPGMTYVHAGPSWSLTLPSNGRPITFNNGDDPTAFLGTP